MNRIINGSVSKAIYDDDYELLKQLVNKGKRIDIQDNLGWAPLHAAVSMNRVNMVELLCRHPEISINSICVEGKTPLLLACERDCDSRIIQTLLENGSDPNLGNHEQTRPLQHAKNVQIAQILIEAGAMVNTQDFNRYTPLHSAIESNNFSVAMYLIDSRADMDLCECNGLNPLMLALSKRDLLDEFEGIEVRLARSVCRINAAACDGWTALMLATNSRKMEVVKILLERGADMSSESDNVTVMHIAVMRQDVELWRLFWERERGRSVPSSSYSILYLMLIHRWYIPERMECFLQAVESPYLHRIDQSFLAFLFQFAADNKLQPEMCRLTSATLEAEKWIKRNYRSEITYLLENQGPLELKRELLSILRSNNIDIGWPQFVVMAAEFEPDLLPQILPYSHIDPQQIWNVITRINRKDASILRLALHILRLSTPTWRSRHRFLQRLPTIPEISSQRSVRYTLRGSIDNNINRLRRVEYVLSEKEREETIELLLVLTSTVTAQSVPSLKELARDVVRANLKNLEAVRSLGLPEHVINIVELRQAVNILPHL